MEFWADAHLKGSNYVSLWGRWNLRCFPDTVLSFLGCCGKVLSSSEELLFPFGRPEVWNQVVSRRDFPGSPVANTLHPSAGGPGSIPGQGTKIPHAAAKSWHSQMKHNQLWYSCLGNPMDRGAWWAAVHRVAQSRTLLSDLAHVHFFLKGVSGSTHAWRC